ncbi:MAG: sigma-70 family RNA polymerase sigma factor [Rhizobacter sp.]|nr:sigma-70 family RNA polymerase sigma factor [Ferruginibacter sp.]
MEITGDKATFLALIEQNKGIIIKICNSYCKNKNDREDLAQEMIYQLWRSGQSFNADYKFSTWMYRVALNVAISFYRQHKQLNNNVALSEWHIEIEDGPEEHTDKENNIHLLQQFISEMKELDKAVLLLWSDSKSYREISEIIGISETNVATKISRLKDKLKQKFNQHQQ